MCWYSLRDFNAPPCYCIIATVDVKHLHLPGVTVQVLLYASGKGKGCEMVAHTAIVRTHI